MKSRLLKRVFAILLVAILLCTQLAYADDGSKSSIKLSVEELSSYDKSVVIVKCFDAYGDIISQGSGFCVGEGVFLTNYHVKQGAYKIQIETDDDKVYDVGGIVAADMARDLVLLKTKVNPNLQPLKIGFDKTIVKGQQIVTIGSPIGLKNTVSEGIVSGIRIMDDVNYIQITAPITYGSSGSPLLDMYGEVIGVNTSGVGTGELNFAVSINNMSDWYAKIKGIPFSDIPIIGGEKYTKDSKINDAEITAVLSNAAKYYNNEDLKSYMDLFSFANDDLKKSYSDALTEQFKEFDVRMEMKNIQIIKKTEAETLVRVETSYAEKNHNRDYRDNTIRTLYYLKKNNNQWRVYRTDQEFLLSITTYYNYDDEGEAEDYIPKKQSESKTDTKVEVVTPTVKKEATPINIKAADVKSISVSVSIDGFKYNKGNNKIYAINKKNKKLIVINAATKKVEKTVSLLYEPSDLCVSTDNKMLYIVNDGSNYISEVKLSDYTVARNFVWDAPNTGDSRDAYHYHIQYYKNKLYLIDGNWSPKLWVLDLGSLNLTDLGKKKQSKGMVKDKIDSVGNFYIDEKTGDIYLWQQFGWSAGYSDSDVWHYKKTNDGFLQSDRASLDYPSFQRNPLDSIITSVTSKNWIVCKNYILNMKNLDQKIYKFDEDLYAVDSKGLYGISKNNIYNLNTFSKVGKVPVQNAAFYFFDSADTLYMVDNKSFKIKYCTIK